MSAAPALVLMERKSGCSSFYVALNTVFVRANDIRFMYFILCLFPGPSPDSTAQNANSPGVTIGAAIGCIAATLVITLGIEGLIFIFYKKWRSNKTSSPERHVHTYTLLFIL